MEYLNLFSGENKKNIVHVLSAELAQRVVLFFPLAVPDRFFFVLSFVAFVLSLCAPHLSFF